VLTRADDRRLAVDNIGHLLRDAISRHSQRLVDLNAALGDTARSVPKSAAMVSSEKARSPARLAKLWRSVCGVTSASLARSQIRSSTGTTPIKMPVAPISRKEERRLRLRLIEQEVNGALPNHASLGAALGVREADRALVLVEPRPLNAEPLHAAEAAQQDEADRR
jgi:hypothetical protein